MIKIIACEVFKPYIELLGIHEDIEYLEIESHNDPHKLSKMIQKKIDESQNDSKILLIYGLCGNALLDIQARKTPVYIVKVHDCLSILLGSKERFMALFQDRFSAGWSYYLKSLFNPPKDIYVSFQMDKEKTYEKKYKEVIQGDLSFLKDILDMNSQELLEIKKDDVIIYDEKEILKKETKNG